MLFLRKESILWYDFIFLEYESQPENNNLQIVHLDLAEGLGSQFPLLAMLYIVAYFSTTDESG
jgi:hypothetical protein